MCGRRSSCELEVISRRLPHVHRKKEADSQPRPSLRPARRVSIHVGEPLRPAQLRVFLDDPMVAWASSADPCSAGAFSWDAVLERGRSVSWTERGLQQAGESTGSVLGGRRSAADLAVPPAEFFKRGEWAGSFSEYDAEGLPTTRHPGRQPRRRCHRRRTVPPPATPAACGTPASGSARPRRRRRRRSASSGASE